MIPDVRLIDANALIKQIEGTHCKDCDSYNGAMCRACQWMDAMDYIEDAPTVDAQPVKHGHWSECWRDPGRNVISVICSACDDASLAYLPKRDLSVEDVPKKIYIQMPYCPKCCAKMDGGDEDET